MKKENSSNTDIPPLPPKPIYRMNTALNVFNEQGRLILRNYLRKLIGVIHPRSSPALAEFLFSNTTVLSETDMADSARRRDLELMRKEENKIFDEKIKNRAEELEHKLKAVKSSLLQSGKFVFNHIII